MNSIRNKLFKGISSSPSFFIISIFITGCSAEFKENFNQGLNQGFQSSFNDGSYISSCMAQYDMSLNSVKKQISRIKFLNYCKCSLQELNKSGEVQLSTIMPGNLMKITDYCYQRELIPLK